jgi:hypothetical protein
METVALTLVALACPVGMGAMMWFMSRGMRSKLARPNATQPLEALREEHVRLGEEIDRLEGTGGPSRTRA